MKTNIFLIILTINIFHVHGMRDLVNSSMVETDTLVFFSRKIDNPEDVHISFLKRLKSLSESDKQEWPIIPIESGTYVLENYKFARKVGKLIKKLQPYAFKDIFSDTPCISSLVINEINKKYSDFIDIITFIYWEMNNDIISNKIHSMQGDMDGKYLIHINKFVTELLQYRLDKINLSETCAFFIETLENMKNEAVKNNHNTNQIPRDTHQFLAFRENNLLHKINPGRKEAIQNYFLMNNLKLNHYIKYIKNLWTNAEEKDKKDVI
jgi:hypothetical protein